MMYDFICALENTDPTIERDTDDKKMEDESVLWEINGIYNDYSPAYKPLLKSAGVWVADIDRIASFGKYLLALHSPVICRHKLATRQGICSYSISGKISVPQRWSQIVLTGKDTTKYYICAACASVKYLHVCCLHV